MDAQGDFAVACTLTDSSNHTDILALKFNASGRFVGEAPVAFGTFQQYQPVVAMDANGDFVVAYTRVTNGNNFDVFAKRYDANCNLLNVITVAATSGREYSPSIAMTPGRPVRHRVRAQRRRPLAAGHHRQPVFGLGQPARVLGDRTVFPGCLVFAGRHRHGQQRRCGGHLHPE
jgi:hypothetical protein